MNCDVSHNQKLEANKLEANKLETNKLEANRLLREEKNNNCQMQAALYAREMLSLGLIWHEIHDAVKEGDGESYIRV